MKNFSGSANSTTTLGVIHNYGIEVINTANIIRCSAISNSTIFHLTSGAKIKTCKTLGSYEDILSPFGFSRFNRGDLVNTSFIKKITKDQLHLTDGSLIQIPLKRNQAFKDFVQALLNLDEDKHKSTGRFPSGRKRKEDK